MKHGILCGEFDLVLDSKRRLQIPADIRKALDPDRDGKAFFIVIGPNRKPWLYPEKLYEYLVFQRKQVLVPQKLAIDFAQFHFGMASPIEWDGQWRIRLPEKTLARTGIAKEVALIGCGDHLEIWPRAEWNTRFEELLNRSDELASYVAETEQKQQQPKIIIQAQPDNEEKE